MISVWWLIPAFFAGGLFSLLILGLLFAGRDDR